PVVFDVADIKVPCPVEADAMWFVQLRVRGRASVTGKARRSIARNRADDSGLGVELPDAVAETLHPIDVSGAIEPDFVRLVQLCRIATPAISTPSSLTSAGYREHFALWGHFADTMIGCVTNIQRAIRTPRNPGGVMQPCLGRRTIVAGEAFRSVAG